MPKNAAPPCGNGSLLKAVTHSGQISRPANWPYLRCLGNNEDVFDENVQIERLKSLQSFPGRFVSHGGPFETQFVDLREEGEEADSTWASWLGQDYAAVSMEVGNCCRDNSHHRVQYRVCKA